ncbi:DNA-binding protein RFX8-like [Cetorhinus maximus]
MPIEDELTHFGNVYEIVKFVPALDPCSWTNAPSSTATCSNYLLSIYLETLLGKTQGYLNIFMFVKVGAFLVVSFTSFTWNIVTTGLAGDIYRISQSATYKCISQCLDSYRYTCDCTHVAIMVLSDHPGVVINQKGFHFINIQLFTVVADSYYNHCQEILQHIRSNQLDKVRNLLSLFWESFTYDAINTSFPDICQLFCSYDAQLYKIIEEILLRDFLGDFSVQHLQSARYFAKKFKSWLIDALEGTPLLLQSLKMRAANMFVNRLRRRTCICNLAKSMHIVLNNHRMVSTLRTDLRAIISQGLLNIPSKSTKTLNCSLEEVGCSFEWKCFDSLLALLDTAADIRAYFQCVSTLVHLFVFQPSNFRGEEFTQLAANFQLRWNYFLSAISRALTLSNAESFGSWHLVNLLISEYLTHVLQSYMEEEMEKSVPESMDQLSHDTIQEPDLESVLKKYSVPSDSLNVKSEQTGDKDLNLQNITIKPLGFKVDTLTGNKLIQVLVEDEPSKSTLKLNLSLGKKAVVTLKNGQTFEIHTSRMQQYVAGDVQT